MDMLRCKTPELVRKEIWTRVLAYNLIRTVMAQAAARDGVPPRSISFKATLQVLEAFRPLMPPRPTAARATGRRCMSRSSRPSPSTASPIGPTASSLAWPNAGPRGMTD